MVEKLFENESKRSKMSKTPTMVKWEKVKIGEGKKGHMYWSKSYLRTKAKGQKCQKQIQKVQKEKWKKGRMGKGGKKVIVVKKLF